jgi:DNA-directed RNA polymerase subunit RPC12/RpoP
MKVYLICTLCNRPIEYDIHAVIEFSEVRCPRCNSVMMKRKYSDDLGQNIASQGVPTLVVRTSPRNMINQKGGEQAK